MLQVHISPEDRSRNEIIVHGSTTIRKAWGLREFLCMGSQWHLILFSVLFFIYKVAWYNFLFGPTQVRVELCR